MCLDPNRVYKETKLANMKVLKAVLEMATSTSVMHDLEAACTTHSLAILGKCNVLTELVHRLDVEIELYATMFEVSVDEDTLARITQLNDEIKVGKMEGRWTTHE